MSYLEGTDGAPSALRTRLELASKEKLIEVILRLAADSEESAARIDYSLIRAKPSKFCSDVSAPLAMENVL